MRSCLGVWFFFVSSTRQKLSCIFLPNSLHSRMIASYIDTALGFEVATYPAPMGDRVLQARNSGMFEEVCKL